MTSVSIRLVVLVSGTGTNLQALLDACADPAYGAAVVAVGADRDGIEALARAERAGVPSFVLRVGDFPDRDAWDRAMVDEVAKEELESKRQRQKGTKRRIICRGNEGGRMEYEGDAKQDQGQEPPTVGH